MNAEIQRSKKLVRHLVICYLFDVGDLNLDIFIRGHREETDSYPYFHPLRLLVPLVKWCSGKASESW